MMTDKMKKRFAVLLLGGAVALCAGICVRKPLTCAAEDAPGESSAEEGAQADMGPCRILNIGSVSKVYTVTAVMQLADRGEVDIDAPVTDYIPDFRMADERYRDITVRMLMNHTSGLKGSVYGGLFLFDEAGTDYHDGFLQRLAAERLKADPGEFNCYCNDGFTLLEILVERVSGMTFTRYLEENICGPLSLDDTGTMWDMDVSRQAPVYANGSIRMAAEYGQAVGAGGIISTAADVCSFGSAFFTGDDRLLSEQSKEKMAENNRTGGCAEDFGLGWDAVRKKDYEDAGVRVLSKGGDTFTQHAGLIVAPDEKISVAVISSGGSSGTDEEMALKLLDIALAGQGITVEHPEEGRPVPADTVPGEYTAYEGLYADTSCMVRVSFPEGKYMQITSVNSDREAEEQYMYTQDGVFVKMSGDVASGKAIPVDPQETLTFVEKDGQIYLSDPAMGCLFYMAPAVNTDEQAQNAWDRRDGVTYYYVNGAAADMTYCISNSCFSLHTSGEAPGYVNGYAIQDEDHADYDTVIPGTAFRDISSLRMETVDGKEYLCLDDLNCRYISEECIPVLTEDITAVDLKTGEAAWFKIDGAKDVTLRLNIPEGAAVCVFDRHKNLRYSSFMKGYGDEVPLPEYGMIVFVGETGEKVMISRADR